MTADEPQPSAPAATPAPPSPRRSSGIVTPRPLKWQKRLAAMLIFALIKLISLTLRYRWDIHPSVLAAGGKPAIFATWHNRLPLSLVMYRRFVRQCHRSARLAAIVSASQDGGVVARVLELFGVQPVRGSSSRRGPQALLELTTWAERSYDLAITPDGPRGPCYVVQSGAIALARLTGLPIVPASYWLGWKIRLKTWDRFQIPLPFSRVEIRGGEVLHVARDTSETDLEALRQTLEERMRQITID